jgi:phosphoribosylanthranilate isomerase
MRAFRLQTDGWPPILAYLDRCGELHCMPRMVLIDAFQPGHYGGTGQTADWRLLAKWRQYLADLPLVLAGGLTADNVANAIDAVHPAAVDTASGVESEPGLKHPQKVQAFVQNARRALARYTSNTTPGLPTPPVPSILM